MPTTDSTDRGFHDYLTGANTGAAYNASSAAGATTHKSPTGPQSSGPPAPSGGGQGVSLPGADAPVWLRIVTGAIVVEGVELAGFVAGEALTRRATFILAVLCGVAALVYGVAAGVPAVLLPAAPYAELALGGIGLALPYAALAAVFAASSLLVTLLTAALTLTLNLLRMAVGLAVVAVIGYLIYYFVTQG